MGYSKWQIAKIQAVFTRNPSLLSDDDDEEVGNPYRTSAKEVIVSRILTISPSIFLVFYCYFKLLFKKK
jgi:hypothetical protein